MCTSKVRRQSVFVSGSYRSKWGLPGVIWNIFKAWRCGRKLVRQGYSVFVPHLNTMLMDDLQPVDFFLTCCLKELPNFEAIYMMRGWKNSVGAREELSEAQKRGLTIWYEDETAEWDRTTLLPFTDIEPCKTVNCSIIAAVDSPQYEKDSTKFVCTGVNDDEVFQAVNCQCPTNIELQEMAENGK